MPKKKKSTTLDDLARLTERGFDGVEKRFQGIEGRLDQIEKNMATKAELQYVAYNVERVKARILFTQAETAELESLADEFVEIKRRLHRLEHPAD